jgi:hypothetical protein
MLRKIQSVNTTRSSVLGVTHVSWNETMGGFAAA